MSKLIPKKQTAWGKLEKINSRNLTPLQQKLLQRSEQARKNIEQARQVKPENTYKAEQVKKEVQLIQNALNDAAYIDKNLSKGYKQAIDNQIQEAKDKFYPYKNMTNSLLTAAELTSAGYFLAKGLGKGTLFGIKKNRNQT